MATTGHTLKAFDDDLNQLRASIAEMGGLAEAAIAEAMRALAERDSDGARRVVDGDKRLDAMEAEIEALAVRIIALRAPMADDLREVVAALKIVGVVERIGDYAKNIAKRVPAIEDSPDLRPLSLLPEMGADRRRDGAKRARRLRRARSRQGGAGVRARQGGGRFLQFASSAPCSPS